MTTSGRRASFLCCVVVGAILVASGPAVAVFDPTPSAGLRGSPTATDLVMSGTGPGQGVSGFIAAATNPFDPVANPYPATNPTSGFTVLNEGFAGIILATPKGGGTPLKMYCIDILTGTNPGIGYSLGEWADASVPHIGYIARLLTSYYPNTSEPASLANNNAKAAAVQAAIWYLSDRYVLNTSDPLRATVAAIVASVVVGGSAGATAAAVTRARSDHGQRPAGVRGWTVHAHLTVRGSRRVVHRGHDVEQRRCHQSDRRRCLGGEWSNDLAQVDRPSLSGVEGHRPSDGSHRQRVSLRRQHLRAHRRPEVDPRPNRDVDHHGVGFRAVRAARFVGGQQDDQR